VRPFKTKPKYGAKRVGRHASKREAAYAQQLQMQKDAGAIVDYLEQVPVLLPGGVKYVIDFAVIDLYGLVRFVEIKGFETAAWKIKMRLLADARPEIWKRLEVVS
jgi:hypothetical protein